MRNEKWRKWLNRNRLLGFSLPRCALMVIANTMAPAIQSAGLLRAIPKMTKTVPRMRTTEAAARDLTPNSVRGPAVGKGGFRLSPQGN